MDQLQGESNLEHAAPHLNSLSNELPSFFTWCQLPENECHDLSCSNLAVGTYGKVYGTPISFWSKRTLTLFLNRLKYRYIPTVFDGQ
jgi:hypothetical protein